MDAFAGLLNVEDPGLVKGMLLQAGSQLESALAAPALARKARLLVRFLIALVVPGVVQPSSAIAMLRSLVDTAISVAESAIGDDKGARWQPYADYLVYTALMALPFGGPELSDSAPDQIEALLGQVDAYMAKRPHVSQPGLRPFAAAVKENDPLAESDNGGASFLGEVVVSIKRMVASGDWTLLSIPRVHLPLEATLATATEVHEISVPEVPSSPPVAIPEGASDVLVAALVLNAYPPRGIIKFLEPQHTYGDRPPIERLVAEDYIIDMVALFEGDRVECAKRLGRNLPLPFSYEPLLCETLFGQMLRLPTPEFKPIMYATLMVDLSKLLQLFPRAMSACVRESFARMNVMDPSLRERLAEWLAYHLSNFEYIWPWAKWEHVLAAPPYDGQRRFCVAVMLRLMRLSYWDRVHSAIPEEFRVLLPPKPEVAALPEPDKAAAAAAEAGDAAEAAWAAVALKMVRSKASAEDIDNWIKDEKLDEVLGGKMGVLRMLTRCLLVAGVKSYTHMIIAFERYYGPLALLAKETGDEGQVTLVDVAARVWALNPQRIVMAVDRMMTLRLVSAEAIVSWVFGTEGLRRIEDQSRSGMAWELLHRAVDKTLARVQDATDDLAGAQAALKQGEAAMAAGGAIQADVDAVRESLPEKESYLEETTNQQRGAVLQVVRAFAEALGPGGCAAAEAHIVDEAALDAEATQQTVLREFMIASLRSFLRRYHVQAAEVEAEIRGSVLADADEHVKDVIESQVKL